MRNFGFAGYDNVIYPGTNGKMTEVAAAIGLTNFDYIDYVVEVNWRNHRAYRERLGVLPGLRVLSYDDRDTPNYQYVVVEVGPECPVTRDEMVSGLHAENVLARKYFWPGCHRMQPYRDLYPHAGLLLPNTEAVAQHVMVLPTGTGTDLPSVHMVCDIIGCLIDGARPNG
ncbi:DegT/DnrJ/EryC1/StrS family aminotransferase [Tahibacter amnicola]|uniref:DegT/DnrJ/EryC1/StrS family aminotransferase n=1 Tax=Tahibacter amnicola TaxID=2976241 RepID=A0ABY6B8J0_9GAMM|nr:DegT/DnrJ/EryC1/StrS family aminotransferase [Tahibacter amnicola]UXI66393.1 DegT/DnrJ/EryC1/StrS family aminotransferase [Tahibacter amnicola]